MVEGAISLPNIFTTRVFLSLVLSFPILFRVLSMNRVFRVNATDRNITYFGPWVGESSDTTWVCTSELDSGCEFFLMFRGTGINMYGSTLSGTKGRLSLVLDGEPTDILLSNGTTFNGDHQLMGYIRRLTSGAFVLDHLEIENSSGGIFNLLSDGPTAQNVPPQAVTVDNTSPEIMYYNESKWTHYFNGIYNYQRSISSTRNIGGSLSYTFDGDAIWYYGSVGPIYGFFNLSIDSSKPQRLNAKNNLYLDQQLIWSNISLGPGRHTISLTHDDTDPEIELTLDFFRVLAREDTSTLLSSYSTTGFGVLPTNAPPVGPTNQNQMSNVPLAIGLTLGLLALVITVLGSAFYLYRRRGWAQLLLDTYPVSPYTAAPRRRADQQSILPPVSKHPPQPARLSGTPMATRDPDSSSSVRRLGPPPSYESPVFDWRVEVVQ